MKEEKERIKMEEENGYGGSSGSTLETSKAERSVWLMKCPVAVAKSWQNHPPSQPLSKVVFSINPLLPEDDPSHLQVLLPFHFVIPILTLVIWFNFVMDNSLFTFVKTLCSLENLISRFINVI